MIKTSSSIDKMYLTSETREQSLPKNFSDGIIYSDSPTFYHAYQSIYSIKYAIDNEDTYRVDGKIVKVPKGGFLVVNNKQEVEAFPGTSKKIKALILFWTPGLMQQVFTALANTDVAMLENYNITENTDLPTFIDGVFHPEKTLFSAQLRSLSAAFQLQPRQFLSDFKDDALFQLAAMFVRTQQQHSKLASAVNSTKVATKRELYKRLLTATAFIHDNWYRFLSLEDIAQAACLSPYHLHRTFRQVFKQTPYEMMLIIKMEKAKEMLLQTPIQEVALSLGYDEPATFSRIFRRMTGQTPSAWKKIQ